MERVVLIGSGNVAFSLGSALSSISKPPVQVFARNEREGSRLAHICGCSFTSDPAKLAEADLYIICVNDRAVKQVASSLDFKKGIVAHTAASVKVTDLPEHIAERAVIYPLQTFTKGREVDMSKVHFFIEALSMDTCTKVKEFVSQLSHNVHEADFEQRTKLHAAAVFACNFTNYMYTVGQELATEAGFGYDLLKPLIEETAQKAVAANSPIDVQTGPAIRNDFQTKSIHCDLLSQRPDLKNIYINLSNNIWETSKKMSQK